MYRSRIELCNFLPSGFVEGAWHMVEYVLKALEGMARYTGLLLALADGFSLQPLFSRPSKDRDFSTNTVIVDSLTENVLCKCRCQS